MAMLIESFGMGARERCSPPAPEARNASSLSHRRESLGALAEAAGFGGWMSGSVQPKPQRSRLQALPERAAAGALGGGTRSSKRATGAGAGAAVRASTPELEPELEQQQQPEPEPEPESEPVPEPARAVSFA